jgi:hypothetical protein
LFASNGTPLFLTGPPRYGSLATAAGMETIMATDTEDGPERLGKALAYVFLAGLAAFFIYGYLQQFF